MSRADIGKAAALLGYEPTKLLDDGLRRAMSTSRETLHEVLPEIRERRRWLSVAR